MWTKQEHPSTFGRHRLEDQSSHPLVMLKQLSHARTLHASSSVPLCGTRFSFFRFIMPCLACWTYVKIPRTALFLAERRSLAAPAVAAPLSCGGRRSSSSRPWRSQRRAPAFPPVVPCDGCLVHSGWRHILLMLFTIPSSACSAQSPTFSPTLRTRAAGCIRHG